MTPGTVARAQSRPSAAPVVAPVLPSFITAGTQDWSPPLPELPADPVSALWRALDEVLDPELPISLVELGLIYGLDFSDGTALVRLTFTATGCPCMDFIREDINDRLTREPWVAAVSIEEVWNPPWTRERITDRGRAKLRLAGVSA